MADRLVGEFTGYVRLLAAEWLGGRLAVWLATWLVVGLVVN